jgi:hypothetical protein
MDSGLEHPFDLGMVNYHKHPTDSNYVVYRFRDINRANYFEKRLAEEKVWFERSNPEADEKEFYLIAIHKKNFNKVQRINFDTEAKHKRFLIKNNFLRYFFVLFMVSILVLASVGYCKQQQFLKNVELEIQD